MSSIFPEGIPMYVFIMAGVLLIAAVGSIVYSTGYKRRMNRRNTGFLAVNPGAAKVYLLGKGMVRTENVTVHEVDHAEPHFFSEGTRTGFYVAPGVRSIVAEYTNTRPGVLYKNVSNSTGKQSVTLTVEEQQEYELGFDRKERVFQFGRVG